MQHNKRGCKLWMKEIKMEEGEERREIKNEGKKKLIRQNRMVHYTTGNNSDILSGSGNHTKM